MNNRIVKRFIKIGIYVALLAVIGFGSYISGLFETVDSVVDNLHLSVWMLFRLVTMVLLMLIIENICELIISNLKPKTQRGKTLTTISKSLLQYFVIAVGICWGLTIIGVDVSTVIASVGVLALIVGFGAESLIADVVTGVFMLFEDQYNVGDVVEVNGFRGTVRSIGIRTTKLEDLGGNVRIINNADMTNILNRSNHFSVSICDIGVPYSIDLEALEKQLPEILYNIYENHTDVFKNVPRYLGVQTLGESSVVLRIVADVEEANIYTGNRVLNRDLFLYFRKAGVEVPFNQLDVHVDTREK